MKEPQQDLYGHCAVLHVEAQVVPKMYPFGV